MKSIAAAWGVMLCSHVLSSPSPADLSNSERAPSVEGALEAQKPRYEKVAPLLKGLILTSSSQDFNPKPGQFSGIKIYNLTIPGQEDELKKKLEPFLNRVQLTQDSLAEIKRTIVIYFRNHNHPVVTVLTPEQDITDGVLQLVVLEGRVGQIEWSGNEYFSNKQLGKYLRLAPGDSINDDKLKSDVAWMNRNPFRHTDLILTPGKDNGTTDIRLVTKDRRPLRLYAGVDNTGTDFTGISRWFAGFNWANAFYVDQILTYQYTTSEDFKKFQAHTINYVIPLPWRNTLTFYGGYSTVHPHIPGLGSHGKSGQGSFRYNFPVGKTYSLTPQDFTIGADYKNTNNTLEFEESGVEIESKSVNITDLYFGYHFGVESSSHRFGFETEVFISPGSWLVHQTTKAYEKLRAGAKPSYIYGRLSFDDHWMFRADGIWELNTQMRLQLSNQNLLPSEQFGLGGWNTVRGYEEREVNTDNALCINFEFKTPAFKLFFRKKRTDSMQFLLFCDLGFGKDHHKLPGARSIQKLISTGPGIRYNIATNLSSRLDWGIPLEKVQGFKTKQRLHFSMILSY